MNGRFASAIAAFAVATAVVTRAGTLPEFFVQLQDRNLAGGALFQWLLPHFGYAFVLALCAALTAGALLLAGWRTRLRGAPDWYAGLAAIVAALCVSGRLGVSLDPIGWICAASLALLLDRDDDAAAYNALGVVALWSLLQGGATLGALLAVLALVGRVVDGSFAGPGVRRTALITGGAVLFGGLQLHDAPWHAYGAHALYLDALFPGAERDRIFANGMSVAGAGFLAILTAGAWYGLRRKARAGDSLTFFALLVLAIADARNLPYFGIICGPVVADAVASFYVTVRSAPAGSVRNYAVTFCAAAAVFVATLTVSEPKAIRWPPSDGSSVQLVALAPAERGMVLCVHPRWCDGLPGALLDDRAGIAGVAARRVQFDVEQADGSWQRELRTAHVNRVVADASDAATTLLSAAGWAVTARDGSRIVLERRGVR